MIVSPAVSLTQIYMPCVAPLLSKAIADAERGAQLAVKLRREAQDRLVAVEAELSVLAKEKREQAEERKKAEAALEVEKERALRLEGEIKAKDQKERERIRGEEYLV